MGAFRTGGVLELSGLLEHGALLKLTVQFVPLTLIKTKA